MAHDASGIPVHCTHSKIAPLGDLKPHPANPNRHPGRQIEVYAAVVKAHGWRRPITVSSRSGFITRGHGARLAALRLGVDMVPVEIQDYPSEAAELADLVADNRVADFSTTDHDALVAVLGRLATETVNAVTGYSPEEIAALLAEVAPDPQYPVTAKLNERHDYVVIYTDSETDFQFLKQLAGVRTERSFKNSTIGEGRVVPFARFLQSLRENPHSIAPPRRDDHDSPPAP